MQGDWRGLECQAHQTDPNSLLHLRTSLSVLEVRTRVRSDEITSGELTECLLEATLENWREIDVQWTQYTWEGRCALSALVPGLVSKFLSFCSDAFWRLGSKIPLFTIAYKFGLEVGLPDHWMDVGLSRGDEPVQVEAGNKTEVWRHGPAEILTWD